MSQESDVVHAFFKHLLIIKMFHFQTKSGFRHLKVDAHMDDFLEKLDRFFEVWQGEFDKLKTSRIKLDFSLKNDENFFQYLDEFADYLISLELPSTVGGIRDDIVSDVRKLQYLVRDFK